MRIYTRYDFPDSKGETRRERNTRLNIESPEFCLPSEGFYLWEWFGDINNSLSRVDSNTGAYKLIPPTEYLAWSKLTGNFIIPFEFETLRAMDKAFIKEINAEVYSERCKKEEAVNTNKRF